MKEVGPTLVVLEECEHKIRLAFQRGLEATCTIAAELRKIKDRELWQLRDCSSFSDYVDKHLPLDRRSITRIIDIGPVVERLRDAGLQLPENESQVAELISLEPDAQPEVWKTVLAAAEQLEQPITRDFVRRAVEFHDRQQPEPEKEEQKSDDRPGVKTALDLEEKAPEPKDDGAPARTKIPERVSFSEKGEAALERIGRLCGKSVREAIEKGNLPISERDLIKWSQEEDSMVEALKYYVVDQRWRVDKAIQFENRNPQVKAETTMGDLVTIIKARGGRLSFVFEGITFNAVALAAA
jgi:hypothetical protein